MQRAQLSAGIRRSWRDRAIQQLRHCRSGKFSGGHDEVDGMGHKTRIMYIERKAGNLTGPARIGRVTFSKTGATIYYRGQEFRSLKGSGFKANYYDVETRAQYWISGPRKDGC